MWWHGPPELKFKASGMETDQIDKAICGGMGEGGGGMEGISPEGMTLLPELEFKASGMETDQIGKAMCGFMGSYPRRDDFPSNIGV